MVPAYGIRLEGLPLTVNGKIDKKRLPPPVAVPTEQPDQYIPPRNDREAELAAMWTLVLGRTRIGIKDSFFGLGGHSLKMIKLMTLIHQKYNIKISLENLFDLPVLEDMARAISRKVWAKENNQAGSPHLRPAIPSSYKKFIMIENLIDRLLSLDVHLQLIDRDQLKVNAKEGSLSGELLAEIRSEKPALIAYLKEHAAADDFMRIPPAAPEPSYVLSSSQRRLWVLSRAWWG